MARKKNSLKQEFSWITEMKDNGYAYMIMPKGKSKVFYATKDDKRMKNGKFYAGSKWDEYRLEKEDQWIPGKDTKNVFIKLV